MKSISSNFSIVFHKLASVVTFVLLNMTFVATAQITDHRGPIPSDRFKVNITKDGISASDFNYIPTKGSWLNVNWIWIDPKRHPDLQKTEALYIGKKKIGEPYVVNFKKIIHITGDVDFSTIKLSADIAYRIFINGRLLNRGPANIGSDYNDSIPPQHWFYDEFSTKLLKKGDNIIAIEVSTFDKIGSSTTTGHGGLAMEASILFKSGKSEKIISDTSWLCTPSGAYVLNPGHQLDYNASEGKDNWYDTLGYDNWSHAVLLDKQITGAWKLLKSALPPMMETRIAPAKVSLLKLGLETDSKNFPITINSLNSPQKLRIEFDNLYTGHLGLSVSGKKGSTIEFATAEIKGRPRKRLNYILKNGEQTYEFWGLYDAKYVDVTVNNPDGDVVINEIVFNHSSFPVSYSGNFICSDTLLNSIWKNIRWVTQMNMQSYHMDSPEHQEPVCDAGDYLIESMVNYYAFNSPLLIKQDLRKIALVMLKTDNKMFHTSYMLLWEQMLYNYYLYTGDKELLKELMPAVYKLMNQFHRYIGTSGIITEAPNYMFMDWGSMGKIPFHHPPASIGQGYMTALYYQDLLIGAEMSATVGNLFKSNEFIKEAQTLKSNFIKTLFDEGTQSFSSGVPHITSVKPYNWLPKDTVISSALPYVNTLAALYGLAPDGMDKKLMTDVIQQNKVTMSPYFMYFAFDAMVKTGTFSKYGLEQLHRWAKLSKNPVGLKEGWAMGDYSHAWGGSPAYILSSAVLGITPALPGFAAIRVAPQTLNLKFSKGIVPTVKGNIVVEWENTIQKFSITVNSPIGIPLQFDLPAYERNDVFINGEKVMTNNSVISNKKGMVINLQDNHLRFESKGVKQNIEIINKD